MPYICIYTHCLGAIEQPCLHVTEVNAEEISFLQICTFCLADKNKWVMFTIIFHDINILMQLRERIVVVTICKFLSYNMKLSLFKWYF